MKTNNVWLRAVRVGLFLSLALICALGQVSGLGLAQAQDNPNPPEQVVKLIFIHHSTGENWLRDDYGELGQALGANNYFVSDTNYGWGPDAIGDRTDIYNWPEWFRGPTSSRILDALYKESGQNAAYTRSLSDPGGENQIVVFKSCFPNSMLEGQPNDPPAQGDGLTVSNARYVYNDLLNYFRTRPDKLFIVITAPPVQDPSLAENARAFNLWLTQDWLRENAYPYNNVAVFDFYNVLTHKDNHHRYVDGQIEYVTSHGDSTSAYPTARDDDHPNPNGSRKATEEFIPLLNIFYHRWQEGAAKLPAETAPTSLPPTEAPAAPVGDQPTLAAPLEPGSSAIDDFEAGATAGSDGWTAFWDEATKTTMACAPKSGMAHTGSQALHINYAVAADTWATCALLYSAPRSWQAGQGLSFFIHAKQPGLIVDVVAYGGTAEERASYEYSGLVTTQEMVDGWVQVDVPWSELRRVAWEADAGSPFNPAAATGMAFGFGEAAPVSGEIWVDDIQLSGAQPAEVINPDQPTEPAAAAATEVSQGETETPPEEPEKVRNPLLPCLSPAGLALLALWVIWIIRRR